MNPRPKPKILLPDRALRSEVDALLNGPEAGK